jgi:hypothetical protein
MALDNQSKVNNLMCRAILLWSEEMENAAGNIGTSPTNLRVQYAYGSLTTAASIAYTLERYGIDQYPFPYQNMASLAGYAQYACLGYIVGLPQDILNVTQSASQILNILSQKIHNITQLTHLSEFEQPNGTSPNQTFAILNYTNKIVSYCEDAINYTILMKNADPKLVFP